MAKLHPTRKLGDASLTSSMRAPSALKLEEDKLEPIDILNIDQVEWIGIRQRIVCAWSLNTNLSGREVV